MHGFSPQNSSTLEQKSEKCQLGEPETNCKGISMPSWKRGEPVPLELQYL